MKLTVTESDVLINWLPQEKKACFMVFADFHGVNILTLAAIIIIVFNTWLAKYLKI